MQVLSIRCGLTRNLGNFESAKLEVEAAPSDGQTHEALLEEVKEYLEKALPESGAGDAKKPKTRKSRVRKPKAEEANAALADGKSDTEPCGFPAENVAVGQGTGQDTTTGTGMATPAEQATPAESTKDGARRVFNVMLNSKTLEALLEQFNGFRDPGIGFRDLLTKEEWAQSINKVQDVYKKLTTSESDANVMHDLVAAINSERNVTKN